MCVSVSVAFTLLYIVYIFLYEKLEGQLALCVSESLAL